MINDITSKLEAASVHNWTPDEMADISEPKSIDIKWIPQFLIQASWNCPMKSSIRYSHSIHKS